MIRTDLKKAMVVMNKSPILAFFLALIPGFGHMYLGKKFRGFLYGAAFLAPLMFGFLVAVMGGISHTLFLVHIAISGLVFGINMLDMIMTLLLSKESKPEEEKPVQNDRFFTILLSFIPGVGHFHLGLNQ